MRQCPTCKGKGKQTVTVVNGSPFKVACVSCKGKRTVSDVELKAINKANAMWCQCDGEAPTKFFQDGEHKGCVTKHHWHCQRCGKIAQIG
jgi:excinuclease UvrABC ATPase subunit